MKNRIRCGLLKNVVVILALALVASCGRSSEQVLNRAAEAWNSEDYRLAAEEYERYLQEHPSGAVSDDVRLKLANINFLNLKRLDVAGSLYREFLYRVPSHPEAAVARERLAECLAESGKSYEAISEYENLAAEDPGNRRIRLRIADLYYEQRNYSQALTEYEKVTEGAPYDELTERAHLREAAVYHLARNQYDQALGCYQKLANHTADPEVRRRAILGIADCYAGLYRFDQAIQTLRDLRDPEEQSYVARRIGELELQKREMSRVPEIRWTAKRTSSEGDAEARAKKQLEETSKSSPDTGTIRQKQDQP